MQYPYIYHRINKELTSSDELSLNNYLRLSDAANYFLKVKDSLNYGLTLTKMANMINKSGDIPFAMMLGNEASEIFTAIHADKLRVYNDINLSTRYFLAGDTLKADSLNRLLIDNPHIRANNKLTEIVLRNGFIYSSNPQYLYEIKNLINDQTLMTQNATLNNIMLARYHYDKGNIDSAYIYSSNASEKLRDTDPLDLKMRIWRTNALILKKMAKDTEALDALLAYTASADSIFDSHNRQMATAINFHSQYTKYKKDREAAERKKSQLLAIILTLISFALIGAGVFVYNRQEKLKLSKLKAEIELERNRRKLIAKMLEAQQNENLVVNVQCNLRDIKKGKSFNPILANKMESFIHPEISRNDEWQEFLEIYSNMHPGFVEAVTKMCPKISVNNLRICCYIKSGMNSAEISKMLMIKQESLRQTRWRIKKMLNVPDDVTLEEFLRGI